jgi:hypothetical protein
MNPKITTLLQQLQTNEINVVQVIDFINDHYEHHPTAFKNGDAYNTESQNQGSARVFSFARLNNLNEQDTRSLFAEHYQSVLAHPYGTDHQNIRQFMLHGWVGIVFEGQALVAK